MAVKRRFTVQLVTMEEPGPASIVRAVARRFDLSESEVCRRALRAGTDIVLARLAREHGFHIQVIRDEIKRIAEGLRGGGDGTERGTPDDMQDLSSRGVRRSAVHMAGPSQGSESQEMR